MGGVWRCILLLDHHIEQRGHTAVGNDDALYRFRLGVFALAEELGRWFSSLVRVVLVESPSTNWKSHHWAEWPEREVLTGRPPAGSGPPTPTDSTGPG